MDIVQAIHSINRWAIVVVAVVALVKFAVGWLARTEYQPMDRGIMSGFTGLLDLQLVLGIILLIGLGLIQFRIEHAIIMVIVVVLVHLSRRWRDAEDVIKYRNNLAVIAMDLILIFVGVTMLPQGWLG